MMRTMLECIFQHTPSRAHLKHGSRQVDGHKDGGQGGVSALHQVDGVEEEDVTGDHQEEEHLSRAMIGS